MDNNEKLVDIPNDCELEDELCDSGNDKNGAFEEYHLKPNDEEYITSEPICDQDDYDDIPYN